jgi:hypothetical protein
MHASRSTRASTCALLVLAAFVALCGFASAATVHRLDTISSPRQVREGKPRVDRRVAVTRSRADRRRHDRGSDSTSPSLAEAVVAPAGTRGGGVSRQPGSTGTASSAGTTTAPPAIPVAPVDPVSTSSCFASPHVCGFPDPTNTGVTAGVSLTPRGSITITQPGTVVSGADVTGTIKIYASNVTVENTRVTQTSTCGPTNSCGNYAIAIAPGLTGVKILRVETRTAPGASCEQDVRNTGAAVTIEAAYLHACDGNIYAAGPTLLKDSYGIAKLDIATDHIENVYFNETSFKAIHDTLLNPIEQTAVIFGNSGGGTDVPDCSNRLTVLGSLLAGGGYTLYPCAHSYSPGSSYLNVQGNHFARCVTKEGYDSNGGHHPCAGGTDSSGYYANSGSYGIATDFYPGTGTWRGNVWDDSLGKVCIDGRTAKRSCHR